MAPVRKSRRVSKRSSRKASRRARRVRRYKGGGTVTIYFMLSGGNVTNVFSSDPTFNVTGTPTPGQVKLAGTSAAKIKGMTVNALGSAAWDAPSPAGTAGSMNTVVSGTSKFYAAKGAATIGVMGPAAVSIAGAGLTVGTDNVTLYNLLSNSSWKIGTTSKTGVSTAGAVPPGGTAPANIRITLTTNP